MTAPIYYDSSDASAPQITANSPASVLAVLKACLVGTSGTAYGSKASAGWGAPYEDIPNTKLVLRAASGNRHFLRLGDPSVIQAGTNSYGRRYFLARVYENMTGIDTGTGAVPTVAQKALNSYYWAWACHANSNAASTQNIPWSLLADDKFFYFRTFASAGINSTSYVSTTVYYFGETVPVNPADGFHTAIYGHSEITTNTMNNMDNPNVGSAALGTLNYHFKPFCSSGAMTTSLQNLYLARAFTQTGSAINVGCHADFYKCSDLWGNGNQSFPDNVNGGLYMSRPVIHENTGGATIRSYLPGLWIPHHQRGIDDNAIIAGAGAFAGTDFLSWRNARSATDLDSFNVLFQLSDWRT